KSSTVMTVLLAIVLFGETNNLPLRLLSVAVLGAGIWLMLDRRGAGTGKRARAESVPPVTDPVAPADMRWVPYALLSAALASATSILAKVGIRDVDSNLATALRTAVVLVMAFLVVRIKGKHSLLVKTPRRDLVFIALSGVATGASWLCYYYALRGGPVSVVVPVDKMSILFAVAFSWFAFRERQSPRALLGLLLMAVGTLGMVFAG
ncbi:MAG TPA: EamA family transporter, partial [Candidatus Limnocylindria bacterium]|nr:EamA family transporter [Candidatus Limnocylindria bacterium]